MTVSRLPQYCWQWLRTPSPGVLYDRQLVWTSLLLMVIGLVMVTSASLPVGLRLADAPFLFAKRHAFYLAVAIAAAVVVMYIPRALVATL
jgi:cell division-specific peptidoglycan biosynthesis regulator FtsW